MVEGMLTWWRREGRPVPQPERRLANGVVWRLQVDAVTKLAVPRITWMPDKSAMQRANRMFEAQHGCMVAQQAYLLPQSLLVAQLEDSVTLTYVSPALASWAEITERVGVSHDFWITEMTGHIFDIEQGRGLALWPCSDVPRPPPFSVPFVLDGLLDTCADDAHDRFLALWKAGVEAVMRTPAYQRDVIRNQLYCSIDPAGLDLEELGYSLSLAPSGLVVRTGPTFLPRERRCYPLGPFDTVVIPWGDLEPLLKPGPWREELLRDAARR